MRTIVYASRAVRPMAEHDLEGLLAISRERNERDGVTGMLLFANGSFLQQIEGDDDPLESCYARICADPRHSDIRLLTRRTIQERRFGDWWMGFDHPDDASLAQRLVGYKPSTTYPLVDANLVHNATVGETLLKLYARNP